MNAENKTAKPVSILDSVEAFAVPGAGNLIDCIHPITGLSWVNGHNLEEIRARYPGAERVNLAEWERAKAAVQDSPITWTPTTRDEYWQMLEVLPPACMLAGGFLVGEAMDHHATSGQPRFSAYIQRGKQYLTASRPMTIREFKAIYADRSASIAQELAAA